MESSDEIDDAITKAAMQFAIHVRC